jgi:RNA polymerase-binding transcription factor DksA
MDDSAVLELLHTLRVATMVQIDALRAEFDAIVMASEMNNADDEHDPEGSTIAFERARVVTLLGQAESKLDDLERSLARLSTGDYDICERCHEYISDERLAALPASRTCVDCARAQIPQSRFG